MKNATGDALGLALAKVYQHAGWYTFLSPTTGRKGKFPPLIVALSKADIHVSFYRPYSQHGEVLVRPSALAATASLPPMGDAFVEHVNCAVVAPFTQAVFVKVEGPPYCVR